MKIANFAIGIFLVATSLQKITALAQGDVDVVVTKTKDDEEGSVMVAKPQGDVEGSGRKYCSNTCYLVNYSESQVRAWCEPNYSLIKEYYETFSSVSDKCVYACCKALISDCCLYKPTVPRPVPRPAPRPTPRPPTRPTPRPPTRPSSSSTCNYCYSTIWTITSAQSRQTTCVVDTKKFGQFAYLWETKCRLGCCAYDANWCCK